MDRKNGPRKIIIFCPFFYWGQVWMGVCPHEWSLKLSKFERPHWNLPLPPGVSAGAAPAPRGIGGGKKCWKRGILKERLLEIIRTMAAPIAPKINFREKWDLSSKKASPILSDRYSNKKWHGHRKIRKRIVYMNKKYWIVLFLYNINLYLSNKNYLYMFNILFYWVMMCFQ